MIRSASDIGGPQFRQSHLMPNFHAIAHLGHAGVHIGLAIHPMDCDEVRKGWRSRAWIAQASRRFSRRNRI